LRGAHWRPSQAPAPDAPPAVTIGIAYGTEMKRWFETAVQDFAATPEGKNIKIHLFPLGSLEGAQAVWEQEDKRLHVWAPASSLYRDTLVKRWRQKHAGGPILHDESLALTPLVFVFWEERYQAFVKKYGSVTFATIGRALDEPDGWASIAGRPDWGKFQFSHTDPAKSNSGLMTLVIMAHEYHHQTGRLSPAEAADAGFQKWVAAFEKHLPALAHSTGALMEEMVRRGPTSFDAVVVYENVAIDYFQAAEGRWGKLTVAYPPQNLWSDHPYYVLDVPWSSPDQRRAAEAFLRFLMSEPQQRAALAHGFRPGNLNVPILGVPDSPFVRYPHSGLHVDLQGIVPPPGEEVVERLLALWEKTGGRK
jgi:ABC-type Fe3+ transport system substrate-binding protein